MLLVVEAAGLRDFHPLKTDFSSLADSLATDAQLSTYDRDDIAQILDDSAYWNFNPETGLISWFEDDGDVDELVKLNLPDSPDELSLEFLSNLILAEKVEDKRAVWQKRLIWMALWVKNLIKPDLYPLPWENFIVVARELAKNDDLDKIPLMTAISNMSVHAALRRLTEWRIGG